jgi:lambda family phage portal protein
MQPTKTPLLYGPDNRPLPSSGANPYGSYDVSRTAGGLRGSLSNWFVSRNNSYSMKMEREMIADRAEDLVANDTHAASSIDSITTNTIGTGLTPQSRPNGKVLGWSQDQVRTFQEQAEWAFHIWQKEADAAGRHSFWQICFIAMRSLLVKGEFFKIPLMVNRPGRTFSLALQSVDPLRIYTPQDKTQAKDIKDGVEFGRYGMPTAYWVANPDDGFISRSLSSKQFTRVMARAGHRPGAMHVFMAKSEEQLRGVSILAPAMKFFKDLNDYLDFELVGAIVAASFPVFIETGDPSGFAAGFETGPGTDGSQKTRYQETSPGQVLYGNMGEKPHILKTDRPGNFNSFVERILRDIGASLGMPYEVIAKDFSKTNYSSARAALLEAWKVFGVYQKWLVDAFCQKVWEMVLEEAWLRGMIILPKGSPDWYDAMHAYTRAEWIPPRKGSIDPKKDMEAYTLAKNNNLTPLATINAEMGQGEWEANLEQIAREKQMERKLGIEPPVPVTTPAPPTEEEDEEE